MTGRRRPVLVLNAALVQLPFGPLVTVQTELAAPWSVAADFDKQRTEVFIVVEMEL